MGSANTSAATINDDKAVEALPTDQVLLQEQGQQKFLGNLVWDAFNLITFGAFEKKKTKKPAENPQPPPKQDEPPKAQP